MDMKGIGGILGKLISGMKDDKGPFFQGGKEGRVFGRLKDALGVASKDEFGNKVTMENTQGDDFDLFSHAKEFAKNMDIGEAEDVLEMQGMLNKLGIKDYEGKELTSDGMLGDRTLSALRQLQGGFDDEQQGPGPWAYAEMDMNEPEHWTDVFKSSSPASNKMKTKMARNKLFNLDKYTGPGSGDPLEPNEYKRKPNKQGPGY
jgi:hypothetical protein